MTSEEIRDNNKKIATFDGYVYVPFDETKPKGSPVGWWKAGQIGTVNKISHSYLCRSNNDLRYYNSWDWLMPVLSKITTLCKEKYFSENLEIYNEKWENLSKACQFSMFYNDRITVYTAVVEFIDWYNDFETK